MQQGLISLPWQSVVIEDPSSEAKKPPKNKTPKQTKPQNKQNPKGSTFGSVLFFPNSQWDWERGLELRVKNGNCLWSWRHVLSSKSALGSAEKMPIALQSLDQSVYERIILFLPLVWSLLTSLSERMWSHSADTDGCAFLQREVPVLCCLPRTKISKKIWPSLSYNLLIQYFLLLNEAQKEFPVTFQGS